MKYLTIILFLVISNFSIADWSGFDYNSGSHVDITSGSLVRPGRDIEIYDYGSGEYKDVEVQSIYGSGSGADVEVYDYNTGEYRTLTMD